MENPPVVIHVNCPVDDGNLEQTAASHAAAFALFRNQCPVGARVADVVGLRGRGREKCAWRVRYVRDGHPEIDAQQLALQIRNNHPNNTEMIRKNRTCFAPGLEIVYSIQCMCAVSPNAGMLIKRSVSVEEIKTELVNLKVEQNIQD